MNKTLTCEEVRRVLQSDTLLLDVMTPEDYAACHIAGAKNACIYEMVFLDRVAECASGRSAKIVVYDGSGRSRAAETAQQRLLQAGYQDVSLLQGGLSAWRASGYPVETGDTREEAVLNDGSYVIDTEKSSLEWIGRNLNNRHYGRVAIQSGEVVIRGGNPVSGSVLVDMNGLLNTDLQDEYWRDLLIRHLKSEDFFDTARYPTASFRLNGWQAEEVQGPELATGVLSGELTIRDVTRPVTCRAIVAAQADGSLKAHATLDIDRTLWNVCYGSNKFFERLGMHLVHDMVSLELFLVANRVGN